MSEIKLSASGDGRGDRGGTEAAPRTPRRPGAVSRHGTIARELTKYANYKSWADKVRGVFAAEADEPHDVNGSVNGDVNGRVNGRR